MSNLKLMARLRFSSRHLTPHRLALSAVAFAIFIETIDTSIVPLALPAMASYFDTDFTGIQWVVLASVLTQASLSLIIGSIGDFLGKKPILISGLILTGIGNILCAVAPTLQWLIVFRVVQGIGLTMAGALILGIVTENFPESQRAKAFGFIGLMVSTGIVLGPLAGGVILKLLNWRFVFVFDLFFVVLAIPLAKGYIGDTAGIGWQKFDVAGALAFSCSLFAFLLAGTLGQQTTEFPDGLLLYTLAGISFLLFIIRELRASSPLLDLNLFRSVEFSIYLGTRYIVFFVYGGTWLLLPFFLETLVRLEPATVGLLLAVHSAVFGAGSWISGHLTNHIGRRPLLLSGLILLTIAYAWMSSAASSIHLPTFILQLIMIGLGSGMLQPPANSIIFGSANRRNLGMVSSLSAVVRIHSRSLGIAVLGGVWVYLSKTWLHRASNTAGLTSEALAQTASFGTVCMIASLIIGTVLLICLVETVLRYHQRNNATESMTLM